MPWKKSHTAAAIGVIAGAAAITINGWGQPRLESERFLVTHYGKSPVVKERTFSDGTRDTVITSSGQRILTGHNQVSRQDAHAIAPHRLVRWEPHYIGQILVDRKVPVDDFNQYGPELSNGAVAALVDRGITADEYHSYPEGLNFRDRTFLHSQGITGEQASQHTRFIDPHQGGQTSYMVRILREGVSLEEASEYDDRFAAEDVSALVAAEVEPEIANRYTNHFGHSIGLFVNAGIEPEDIEGFEGLQTQSVVDFRRANMSPADAQEYMSIFDDPYIERYKVRDAITLFQNEVTPEIATSYFALNDKYGAQIRARDIVFFHEENVSPQDIEENLRDLSVTSRIAELFPGSDGSRN